MNTKKSFAERLAARLAADGYTRKNGEAISWMLQIHRLSEQDFKDVLACLPE